jgi:hypothetical protein
MQHVQAALTGLGINAAVEIPAWSMVVGAVERIPGKPE